MTPKTISRTIETEIYACDICQRVYNYSTEALKCEAKHTTENCSHEQTVYLLNDVDIELKCKDCHSLLENESLDFIGGQVSQETLKGLFNLIKQSWKESN